MGVLLTKACYCWQLYTKYLEQKIPPLISPMDERCRKIKCQTLIKIGMMNIEGAIHAGVTCCWTEQATDYGHPL